MRRYVCARCKKVYHQKSCTHTTFVNDDVLLKKKISRTKRHLQGLIGPLDHIIINVEKDDIKKAVNEFLATTGASYKYSFEDNSHNTVVLWNKPIHVLFRTRKKGNPFHTVGPKSQQKPNARLETFVFRVKDITAVKKKLHKPHYKIIETQHYKFLQTKPSPYTGNSIGYVQWKEQHFHSGIKLPWKFSKPKRSYLTNIRQIDHCATRITAKNRDKAVIEFCELTNYVFKFSIYVKSENSITNVTRLSGRDFAMVFTSGIHPGDGPTEKFVQHYGKRVHHIAFRTTNIINTYKKLRADGMKFLVHLVGSPQEGLRQTFSVGSRYTYLVNEYIHRYGTFDGFFTKSNVHMLTKASGKQ